MEFLQGHDYEVLNSTVMFNLMRADDGFVASMPLDSAEGGSAVSPSPRVRKLFPETWLWSNSSIG